jgi:hypothetical protein
VWGKHEGTCGRKYIRKVKDKTKMESYSPEKERMRDEASKQRKTETGDCKKS